MTLRLFNRFFLTMLIGVVTGYYLNTHINESLRPNRYYQNFDYTIPFYGLTFSGHSQSFIDRVILQYGAFERPILHILRDLALAIGRDNVTFLDIGANTGHHSVFMSRFAKEVIAVEPYPPVLEMISKNITDNALTNVRVFPVGFSNVNSSLPFYLPPESNTGVGSFSKEFSERFDTNNDKAAYIELPLVVADEYLKKQGVQSVKLVKLDIEGYEKYALQGMQSLLAKDFPIIVMELNFVHDVGFKNVSDLRAVLPEGYVLFEIEFDVPDFTTGHYQISDFLERNREQRNILLVPHEKLWIVKRLRNTPSS